MKYSDKLIDIVKNKSLNQIAKNKTYLNLLKLETSFLSDDSSPSNRVGYVIKNIHSLKFCEICGKNEVVYNTHKKEFKTCSRSCGGKKSGLTMKKTDINGISIKQKSAKKRLNTLKIIDKTTGLSKAESIELKRQKTMSQIDLETGLKRSALVGLKTKESLNKINLATGLSPAQAKEEQRNKTLSKIDPVSGLTGHQKARKAQWETMSQIDDSTGISKYVESRKKQHTTMCQPDPDSGVSGMEIMINRSKHTKLIVDSGTGLNSYQSGEIKRANTMSQIDPKTGIKLSKLVSNKIQNAMKTIDPITGKTLQEITLNKIKNTSRTNAYLKKLKDFPMGYTLITSLNEYIDQSDNTKLKYTHECGATRESYWPYIRCNVCYPYIRSNSESNVIEYCESLFVKVIRNSRKIINPLELDIYIPDHNLAIEYDGIYWHSSEFKDSNYHLNKTRECEKQGIQLFHIFENEWHDSQKQKIWKSIISNYLGQSERIYARKTEIRSVSHRDTREFLDGNHLQGNCNSSVNLGLYLDGELVSIMTFGRSRYDKKVDWELLRFCNKIGYSVVGGASKLLKAFRKEHSGSIISYADKRRSNGNLYNQLGFKFSHESGPNYWYFKDQGLESRIKYQKHKLSKILETYDSDLTESENMYENGYHKIYDCGNQVWILN